MATFNNGEAGLSVRTKLNNVLQHADGTPSTLTFNDAGADVDVRIEGVGQTHAFFLDAGTSNVGIGTSTASSKLTVTGDVTASGVATAVSMRDSTTRRIVNPGGGSYTTTAASVTGAIAITLPVGYTSHMMRATIKVFEYATQESFDIVVAGYNFSTGPTWASCSAYIVGSNANDVDFAVRFGFNAATSKCVIYIGELSTTWAYPQINITDVQLGYNTTGLDAWDTDWSIGFEASAFQNVTQTLTNNRVGARLRGSGQTTAALTDAGLRGDLLRLSSTGTAAGTGGGIIFTSSQSDTANSLGMAAIKSLLVSGATNTTGDLAFSTRNAVTDVALTERMRITSVGNLGIGTSSPASKVQISTTDGSAPINTAGFGAIRLTSTATAAVGAGPTILFEGQTGNITPSYAFAALQGFKGSATAADYSGTLAFYTQNSGGSSLLTERMRIDGSGNVGIGTTSMSGRLNIVGPGSTNVFIKGGTSTNQGSAYYVQKAVSTDTLTAFGDSAAILGGTPDLTAAIYTNSGIPLIFAVAGTEKMRISSAGNLSLGVTTPSAWSSGSVSLQFGSGGYSSLVQATGGDTNLTNNAYLSAPGVWNYIATIGASRYQVDFGNHRWFTAPSGTAGNPITWNQVMSIDSNGLTTVQNLDILAPSSGDTVLKISKTGSINATIKAVNAALTFGIDGSGGGTERMRINNSGAVLIGTTAGRVGNGITPNLQLEGTTAAASTIMTTRNSADVNPSGIYLAKSRGAALGAVTAVASGDQIGSVTFLGADGTGLIPAAAIIASVDGTPGTNDMPGRLSFLTTADGAATSTERMRIDSAGNVGIGDATPDKRLTVYDPTNPDVAVLSHATATADTKGATLLFRNESSSGTLSGAEIGYRTGSAIDRGSLVFSTSPGSNAPVERMRVIADGNVSIGWGATPPQKLSILEGNIQLTRTGGAKLFLSDESLTVSVESVPVAATSDLLFKTTNTERVRIDSAGRTLIGTTTSRAVDGTSNPILQLETIGTATLQSSMSIIRDNTDAFGSIIYLGKSKGSALGSVTAVVANDRLGGIASIGADGTDINNQSAYIMFEVDGTVGTGSVPGRIVFATTAAAGTTSAEAMRIDSGGDVGIGTTNPTAKLEVRGAALGGTAGDTSLISMFGALDANASYLRILSYRNATGTSHTTSETRIQRRVDSTDMGYIGFTTTDTVFGTGTSTELMRLTNAGRLGIGTATPATSSVLELSSTTRGFLPPRMTTTERNAISSPATGLVIFNTTTAREEGYDGAQWIPRVPTAPDEDSVINGGFDIWQRGTSSTALGYVAADRWLNNFIGGTVTQSRQAFTLGDLLGSNCPTYFLRQSVTGQTLASQYAVTTQRFEGVRTYAGQVITVLGWAKRATAGNMAVSVDQIFGTGGTPSADVYENGQLVALTTSWAPFAITLTVPSITGKTLGTNNNDFVQLNFWASAGSDFNARSGSLGLQTTDIDLWGIHVRDGTWLPTDANLYHQKDIASELDRCQRYYYRVASGAVNTARFGSGYATATTSGQFYIPFPVQMRVAPTALEQSGTATHYAIVAATAVACNGVPTFTTATPTGAMINATVASGIVNTAGVAFASNGVTAAYLGFSAEI